MKRKVGLTLAVTEQCLGSIVIIRRLPAMSLVMEPKVGRKCPDAYKTACSKMQKYRAI